MRLLAERGDEGGAALADQFADPLEALVKSLAEFVTMDANDLAEAGARLRDLVIDHAAAVLDRIGDLGARGDDLFVDRDAATLDRVRHVAAGGEDLLVDGDAA